MQTSMRKQVTSLMGRRVSVRRLCRAGLLLAPLLLAASLTFAQVLPVPLTLKAASSRALADNPDLRGFDFKRLALEGRRLSADQSPAYELSVEAGNVMGSGAFKGTESAEYTLSLSSVIELGGKRGARVAVAAARQDQAASERRAETLDVLGRVTQEFVAALAIQEKLRLAADAVDLARMTKDIVERRARQGAAPEADVLRAQATLAQAGMEQAGLRAAYEVRKVALAALWGSTTPEFETLQGNLFKFDPAEDFQTLYRRAQENPAIHVYASERRIQEAELRLAQSQAAGDIRWQVGVRRFESTGDTAAVAGISIPLFGGMRQRGEVQAATAARGEAESRKQGALLRLHGRLFDAYRTRQANIESVAQLRATVLPALTHALELTQAAYEQGRYRYVEWVAAQRELLSAKQALVDAASTALLNQTLIEQLTAQALGAPQASAAR